MALKIVWTPQALKGLETVISYLEEEWTSREIIQLESNINHLLEQIKSYPKMCPATGKFKNVHKELIAKTTILYVESCDINNKI